MRLRISYILFLEIPIGYNRRARLIKMIPFTTINTEVIATSIRRVTEFKDIEAFTFMDISVILLISRRLGVILIRVIPPLWST